MFMSIVVEVLLFMRTFPGRTAAQESTMIIFDRAESIHKSISKLSAALVGKLFGKKKKICKTMVKHPKQSAYKNIRTYYIDLTQL